MEGKKCPDCKSDILKAHGAEVKCRSKIVKWTVAGFVAVCKKCGTDVPITKAELKSVEDYIQKNS